MALFDTFRLTVDEVERALNRPLTGDPGRGEKGALSALNARRFGDLRRMLERDPAVGGDARAFFQAHLKEHASRWDSVKHWQVAIPLTVWDEYARESRLNQTSITRCLGAAIRRDFDHRQAVQDPLESLRNEVRAYHKTQSEMLERVEALIKRLGDIQTLTLEIKRIATHLRVAS